MQLKCKNQLLLSGCGFLKYWGTLFLAFLSQYSITPILLFLFVYAIPPLNVAAFNHPGAILSLVLIFVVEMPAIIILTFCLSFCFKKKETAISVLNPIFVMVIAFKLLFLFFKSFVDYIGLPNTLFISEFNTIGEY